MSGEETAPPPAGNHAGPPAEHPAVTAALALERSAQAQLALVEQVERLGALVEPASRQYAQVLTARAGVWRSLSIVLEALRLICESGAGLLKGWWGGPVTIMVLALCAAMWLASAGWGPADITHFTTSTVRAVRCDASMPSQPDPASLSAPLPAP